ncbi:hypothetical protein PLICRDRAFT_210261 [Plicaturopsis crispa FD-325 SS-3]|nr:hypothetical protein PLICRDRAFT_210261 [Plicaturopsis crispa FD-325 SS-3]
MALHVSFMSLAFFVALPAGIAMRSVKHSLHGLVVAAFYGLCALGSQGYWILLFSFVLTTIDVLAFFHRLADYIRSGEKFAFKAFWNSVVLNRQSATKTAGDSEYIGLMDDGHDGYDDVDLHASKSTTAIPLHANDVHVHFQRHNYSYSASSERTVFGDQSPKDGNHSDETLHDHESPRFPVIRPTMSLLKRIGNGAFATGERALVFAGFAQLLSGIVVYTGGCRENYINGCLAHTIKGGIFWLYGLVTFARFLGSFSELGWAWNRSPSDGYRFGANPGDPYTTKQIQHIGIAVMFWFAGLVGMALESKTVRRWLASSVSISSSAKDSSLTGDALQDPPSYISSFNPFPALVIGVTGAAMSAHAQTYLFQVQIHALWGWLLLGFSVLRCLTYFFLWLGPPRSVFPSRPPTEALGSFFLACGGLMFIFSTEELTLAAMRRGRDDMMMFLNVAVAITCFAFCWTFCVVAFKGWLKSRALQRSPA